MNRPARFTVADLRRALKAAKGEGPDYGVEIAVDGTIRIARRNPSGAVPQAELEPRKPLVF